MNVAMIKNPMSDLVFLNFPIALRLTTL